MEVNGHIPIWQGLSVLRINAAGRRAYNPEFKAWIVEQACLPGMSVAGLAMRNQVNANQLRHWVLLHQRGRSSTQTASPRLLCVFRPIVTTRSGIVTAYFGIVTGLSGIVTDRAWRGTPGCV